MWYWELSKLFFGFLFLLSSDTFEWLSVLLDINKFPSRGISFYKLIRFGI